MNNSNAHANTAPVKKIRGLKRKLIQIAAFGFTNAHIPNFLSGKLYTGKWKEFCVPGLNCYSCPAATFACPIGALQAVTGSRKSPISFYVFGLLLAFGVIFGENTPTSVTSKVLSDINVFIFVPTFTSPSTIRTKQITPLKLS